jgi:hypothetical protein
MARTKSQLLTANIWKSITGAIKRSRRPAYVAVAYFGQGASKLLPLRPNSRLVVDASENAVKSGQTHPADLKVLQKSGVIIYSVPRLHAKIYVCEGVAMIGSANASRRSSETLIESMLRTTEPRIVLAAKSFVSGLCLNELTPTAIDRLQSKYRPPRIPQGEGRALRKTGRKPRPELPRLFLAQLVRGDPPKGTERAQEKGGKIAKARRKHGRSYVMEDFHWWGKVRFKRQDKVIQVVKEESGHRLVDAPGEVIHVEPWNRNERKGAFVYLELPRIRRVGADRLARKLGYGAKKKLKTNGLVRDQDFAELLLGNWSTK